MIAFVTIHPGYAAYRPPPPPPPLPLSPRWLLAAIGASALSLLLVFAAFIALVVFGSIDSRDFIENDSILQVVETECSTMTETVEGLAVRGSLEQQADTIDEQNQAIERMVRAVRALDPALLRSDLPTLEWTDDWELLIKVRSDYAEALRRGAEPDLAEPKDADGDPIIERMDFASSPECEVPMSLLDPYPEDQGSVI